MIFLEAEIVDPARSGGAPSYRQLSQAEDAPHKAKL